MWPKNDEILSNELIYLAITEEINQILTLSSIPTWHVHNQMVQIIFQRASRWALGGRVASQFIPYNTIFAGKRFNALNICSVQFNPICSNMNEGIVWKR